MSWHLVCVDTNSKGLPVALLYGKERLEVSVITDTSIVEYGRVFAVRCCGSKVRLLRKNNGFWYVEGSGEDVFYP